MIERAKRRYFTIFRQKITNFGVRFNIIYR